MQQTVIDAMQPVNKIKTLSGAEGFEYKETNN
jgi:hypothetical protein